MTRVVSMLRGINVSGHRKIAMADLRALYERLGHAEVATYVQSGNVVFTTSRRDPRAIGEEIQRCITRDLGHDVAVVIRTRDQMKIVFEQNPFLIRGCAPAVLHVTFASADVDSARLSAIVPGAYSPDEFQVRGGEIYLHCPRGYGNTKLNNAFWERKLGVTATTRNWNTVTRLLDLAR